MMRIASPSPTLRTAYTTETDAASKNVTLCFSRLRAAFPGSHSNTILYIRNVSGRPASPVGPAACQARSAGIVDS